MFDTHAHYDSSKFSEDRAEVIRSLPRPTEDDPVGVRYALTCGDSMESSRRAIALSEEYEYLFAAGGVHPHEADGFCDADLETLRMWYLKKKIVAIGEIGLDYHYDFSPRDVQKRVFSAQLALARELGAPVIIHDREAHADVFDAIKESGVSRGVMHSYSGRAELAREYMKLGFYISFSGSVTFKNAAGIVEAAKSVPPERLLIETDAPYLAPVPHRGRRNDSHLMYATAKFLAELKGVPVENLISTTRENAKCLFSVL
ncbi:MAG: TatD family hydrolase [Clostridia bacterium]|nr:TatD family hydrolase [Clostridia bacterium]